VSLHDHHLRISPSLFNDSSDVERLLAALPRA
jgi:selenocysteine lyase/cysteine desulfurase